MSDLLEVKNVVRVFQVAGRELSVLKDVSLSVARGEFVAVMGQSGSGKSTLLHVVAGLIPVTAGRIIIDGRDVTDLAERPRAILRRRTIGYVFQNFNLMPQLTARENVELPLRINRMGVDEHAAKVEGLLRTMELWERREHRPHELSGGELQRVSIARAMVVDAPLILADEPTGNLATRTGQEVLKALRRAASEGGRAILMVTHNPYDAAQADRVLFLKDGAVANASSLQRGEVDAPRVLDRLKELGI